MKTRLALTFRQKQLIYNMLDDKLNQIESLNIPLNDDVKMIRLFRDEVSNCDSVTFHKD